MVRFCSETSNLAEFARATTRRQIRLPTGAAGEANWREMEKLVPPAGIEPATFGLQNRCSTN